MTTLVVSEIFGPTVQGEGPSLGRRCAFVRLGRCNLHCSWCDTPYTWDWQGLNGRRFDPTVELVTMPVQKVAEQVRAMGVRLVVLTGGEPMLQRHHLPELIAQLEDLGECTFEIETNGTIAPTEALVAAVLRGVLRFNVSPKLASADAGGDRNLSALRKLAVLPGTAFKFVAVDRDDLDEIGEVVATCELLDEQVWVMPEGRTSDDVNRTLRLIANPTVARGWNLTTRLHVEVWGDVRGH